MTERTAAHFMNPRIILAGAAVLSPGGNIRIHEVEFSNSSASFTKINPGVLVEGWVGTRSESWRYVPTALVWWTAAEEWASSLQDWRRPLHEEMAEWPPSSGSSHGFLRG